MARAWHPCPTCPALAPPDQPRCPTCTARQRKRSRARNPRTDAAYASTSWRTTRRIYLSKHPHCQHPTCTRTAEDVDHIIPRRILVAAGINNPDHERWLQALCHPHHSSKTRTTDKPLLARLDAGEDPQALALEADHRE